MAPLLARLSPSERERLNADWPLFAHPHQLAPALAHDGTPWVTWLIVGGRGAGKTRAGAEWVRALAQTPNRRIALVGESEHEVREVMIEGVSGVLAVHARREQPLWIPSRRRVEWRNGSVAEAFSADDPESLRGPQFHAAWCDELAKWRQAEKTFDMLQFTLRLGAHPCQVITTTPRPTALIKRLLAAPTSAVTRAGTVANAHNLSPVFLSAVVASYAGTLLGRQEIDGELIEDRPDALWSRALIERGRVATAPPLDRIVVAVDPPGSTSGTCGIVAAGGAGDQIYVLADASVSGFSPSGWAARATGLWRALKADALVAEDNHGGDMVREVLYQADPDVPVRPAHAMRGKHVRAEPVAMLYEQGRVRHVGIFGALEDEMCAFGLDGLASGRSPDRLDALVWAVSTLTYAAAAEPRIRTL